jgi:hypothetical protein
MTIYNDLLSYSYDTGNLERMERNDEENIINEAIIGKKRSLS